MNTLKLQRILSLTLALVFACIHPALAGVTKDASVVIYNSGQAEVTEVRSVTLPRGPATVLMKSVPTTLDATSVRASAKETRIEGIEYKFEPITEKNLLERFIGKELSILMPDTSGGEGQVKRQATLVSLDGNKPIFRVGKSLYSGYYSGVYFPSVPEGMDESPALILDTHNSEQGKRNIKLSYLMSGLTWQADYALEVDASGENAKLTGWATINNSIDHDFLSASVTLVAGNVRRAHPMAKSVGRPVALNDAVYMESAPMAGMHSEKVSQYHTYSLDGTNDFVGGATRQIRMFDAPKVALRTELVSRYSSGDNYRASTLTQGVESRIVFENSEKSGLGRPIPAGLVRVFMPMKDGKQLMVGEPSVGHTGVGKDIRLTLGQAFDVSVERSKVDYKKLGKQSFEVSWKLSVTNSGKKSQAVKLEDMFSGQWEVTKASHKYTKPDGDTLQFSLQVPPSKPGKPTVVTYTARISY